MAKEEVRNVEKNYPWGKITPTRSAVILLLAFNLILVSSAFIVQVELPFLLDPRGSEGDPKYFDWDDVVEACLWISAANIALVTTLTLVGGWLNTQVEVCKQVSKKCKWWCLCCNKWLCWLVTVLKWVTWFVTIVSTIITTVLVFTCWLVGLF